MSSQPTLTGQFRLPFLLESVVESVHFLQVTWFIASCSSSQNSLWAFLIPWGWQWCLSVLSLFSWFIWLKFCHFCWCFKTSFWRLTLVFLFHFVLSSPILFPPSSLLLMFCTILFRLYFFLFLKLNSIIVPLSSSLILSSTCSNLSLNPSDDFYLSQLLHFSASEFLIYFFSGCSLFIDISILFILCFFLIGCLQNSCFEVFV